jgi:hypothetical protein
MDVDITPIRVINESTQAREVSITGINQEAQEREKACELIALPP